MEAVSNQSYKKLEPLPLPTDRWDPLINLIKRVVITAAVIALFSSAGAGICLAEIGFEVIDGAIVGGLVGVVASIVIGILVPIPTSICQYRLDTLNDVESQIAKGDAIEKTFRALNHFFTYPLEGFSQTYQNHELHNAISFVGESIDPKRPDVKKVWKAFLEHLHQTKVVNADGETIELDFSMELDRLEGKQIQFDVQHLSSWWGSYEKDLEQIEELEKVCFGKVGTFTKEQLKAALKQPGSGCVVARRKGTSEILGFGWYLPSEDKISIAGFARAPGAANLSVGNALMYAIINAHSPSQSLQLHVRKSNPAVKFYEKWGFTIVQDLPGYVAEGPPEDAYLMELDWEKYQKKEEEAGAA